MTTTAPGASATPPGALFDIPLVPTVTQYYDELDSTDDLSFTLPTSTATTLNGIQPLTQTDVVLDVELEMAISQTYTKGTGQTLTVSPWAPWNLLRDISMPSQNVYSSVEVSNGAYLAFVNAMRPLRHTEQRLNLYANPAGYDMASGTLFGNVNSAGAQSPLQIAAQYTDSVSSYNLLMRIPIGIWFDEYWSLNALGQPVDPSGALIPPISTFVAPLYMASANKVVQPRLTLAAPFGSADQSPVYTTTNDASGDTASTFSGSGTVSVRRYAVRGQPASLPPAHAWQYQVKESSKTMGATTKLTYMQDPQDGQVLSSTLVLFDPGSGSAGAPISTSSVKRLTYTYGSGAIAFQGTPQTLQRRFLAKHGFLPPPGFYPLDHAVDDRGRVTNRIAASQFDTYNTTGIGWTVEFSTAPSDTATATLLSECLRLVQ